jgi:hypothetical protein
MNAEGLLRELRDELARLGAAAEVLGLLDPEVTQTLDAAKLYHYESPTRAHLKYVLTMKLPVSLRDQALERVFRAHVGSPSRWAHHWYIGWDELVEMQIGGHGYVHNSYSRLSPGEVRADILRTATTLRDGLGPDLRPFSFPYGGVPAAELVNVADLGFAHAFTTEPAFVQLSCDPLRIPRFDTIAVGAAVEDDVELCARA